MMKILWFLGLALTDAVRLGTASSEVSSDLAEVADEDLQLEPSKERIEYVNSKMAVEHEVVKEFTPRASELQELASGSPKVAFLFLTMKAFPWADVWDAFFEDATKGTYSIYIHRAALKEDDERQAHELPLAKYGAIDVPWVKTAWCALFGVEVASLFAAMQDPSNVQFVFVSDSSVPLKPYRYVYEELVRNSPQTSKICLAPAAYFGLAKPEMAKQEATQSCVFRDFLQAINPRAIKHHQWAVFNRQHAKFIVQYAEEALKIYEDVWLQAAPDIKNLAEGCSDEAVPLIALLHALEKENKSTGNTWMDLSRLGVEQNCLTYVRWRNCFIGTPLELASPWADATTLWNNLDEVMNLNSIDVTKSALKRELNGFPHAFTNVTEDYLEDMVGQNFMFARKFNAEAQVVPRSEVKPGQDLWGRLTSWTARKEAAPVGPGQPLTKVLPKLWAEISWRKARESQWSHLETSGQPSYLGKP